MSVSSPGIGYHGGYNGGYNGGYLGGYNGGYSGGYSGGMFQLNKHCLETQIFLKKIIFFIEIQHLKRLIFTSIRSWILWSRLQWFT